jgi:hypothetical protein
MATDNSPCPFRETTERDDGVGDLSADLVDHETLNEPDLAIVRTLDSGALDLVAWIDAGRQAVSQNVSSANWLSN